MGLTLDQGALAAAADWDSLTLDARGLVGTLQSTRFPGAVIPARDPGGDLVIYAAASTTAEWRKLQPLLLAFAGPTFTDFEGAPDSLDPARPVDQVLLDAGVASAARLRPGRYSQSETVTVRALLRLASLLEGAPDLAIARPEPTARLLAALQDALNGGDVAEAWRILAVLREESRLEALNLVQLEIQILGAAGDWGAVRWHDRFEALSLAGPSPATAEILLEAVYWTAAYDSAAGAERAPELVRVDPAMEYARLLLSIAPNPSRQAVERLRTVLIAPHEDVPREAALPREAPPTSDPVAMARAALITVAGLPAEGDPAADAALLGAINALSAAARDDLLRRPANRAIWQEVLERTGDYEAPADWTSWVDVLPRDNFASAASAAAGATAWRLPDEDTDVSAARALAAKIEIIPDGLAEERFGQATPYLVQWAQSDPRWPRRDLCPVYVAILTRMALSARRGETALRSAAGLLEGALQCGLSATEYRDALDAAQTIASEGLSRTSAYDALEIVEIARSFTPIVPAKLQDFSVNVISVLTTLWTRLSEGQRLTLAALAVEVGIDLGDASSPAETALESPALEGKILGIYTLTEPAARQAEGLLRGAIPNLTVELNHDHGGSAALGAMVARAELVVIVWASAKHAATDFIKARRGDRPLVYATGRGATSIVRAVEDWSAAETRRREAASSGGAANHAT
ncbi:MAG TPA: protein DpdD [Caulobacteraceae bacterium]|nr:protein DpdD [Caulobacteraceae bacterium]